MGNLIAAPGQNKGENIINTYIERKYGITLALNDWLSYGTRTPKKKITQPNFTCLTVFKIPM